MLNPFRWSFRAQYVTGFIACVLLMTYAYYEQFAMAVEPKPLCIFQRIVVIVMGIVFLIGAIQNPGPSGRRIYGILELLTAFVGVGIAAQHIWVQHQPPDPFAGCAPGWNYMVNNFPISKVLKMAFTGSADCSQINWTFLTLPMPEWTLICFVLLGAGAAYAGFRKR